jgi:hypothetical protein
MDAINLAAKIVKARHNPDDIAHEIYEALLLTNDREELLVETMGLIMGVLHGAGHISVPVSMMLEVFSNVPDAIDKLDEEIHVVKIADVDSDTVAAMFDNVTNGTPKEDRVWSCRLLPGGVHAVVLEGTGFTPRYVAVIGGDHDQVEDLRGKFAARDGR